MHVACDASMLGIAICMVASGQDPDTDLLLTSPMQRPYTAR